MVPHINGDVLVQPEEKRGPGLGMDAPVKVEASPVGVETNQIRYCDLTLGG